MDLMKLNEIVLIGVSSMEWTLRDWFMKNFLNGWLKVNFQVYLSKFRIECIIHRNLNFVQTNNFRSTFVKTFNLILKHRFLENFCYRLPRIWFFGIVNVKVGSLHFRLLSLQRMLDPKLTCRTKNVVIIIKIHDF